MKFKYIFLLISSFLYANSSTSYLTCSSSYYHTLKHEFNLDMAYTPIGAYAAEAFVSKHIYSIDKERDVGEEFQFGENHIAKLLVYEQDETSGFEAGLYEVDNERLIIAFGGTTSQEKYAGYNILEDAKDFYTDSILLSERTTSYQVNAAAIFLQNIQAKYPDRNITATGHSLGGGLAQFASIMSKQYSSYKKIKAVTFNTAPIPLTDLTKKWVENLEDSLKWADENNINFMTNLDPLTNVLISVENYAKDENSKQYPRIIKTDGLLLTGEGSTLPGLTLLTSPNLMDFKIDTGNVDLNSFFNDNKYGKKLKMKVFNWAQLYMNQNILKLTKLIYGKRIILDTNTGHFMLPLLNSIYTNLTNYTNFRNAFNDVPKGNIGYCNVMYLMQSHIISYPKSERQYKYYPNKNVTNYEAAIYIVNSFFYTQYRVALANNSNLTKFEFFKQKIVNVSGVTQYLSKNDPMQLGLFTNIIQEIYKEKILHNSAYSTIATSDKESVLSTILFEFKISTFGFNRFKTLSLTAPITRMQMTNWIVDSLKINYEKIIKNASNEVADTKKSKTAAGSLDVSSKSYFIYEPIPNSITK